MSRHQDLHQAPTNDLLQDLPVVRLLQNLNAAEPAPGLNDRLLAHLQVVAAEPLTTRSRHLSLWPGPAVVTAVGLVVLACGLAWHQRLSRTPRAAHPEQAVAMQSNTRPAALGEAAAAVALPAADTGRTMAPERSVAGSPVLHLGISNGPLPHAALLPPTAPPAVPTQAELDARALEDLQAPSRPATPFTPTRNEQLLGQMVSAGNAGELAQLERWRDPQRQARDSAAFHSFFEPRAPAPASTQQAPPGPDHPGSQ